MLYQCIIAEIKNSTNIRHHVNILIIAGNKKNYLSKKIQFFLKSQKLVSMNINEFTIHIKSNFLFKKYTIPDSRFAHEKVD